jgi:hypothetical protein
MNYRRTTLELKSVASNWWPDELKTRNANGNILPTLLKTQDDFLKILALTKDNPFQIFDLIRASKFPANLFLKHLCILSDYGGEPIQRLGNSFEAIFPNSSTDNRYIEFIWKEQKYQYTFKKLPVKGLKNSKLHLDAPGLLLNKEMSDLFSDMIVILLYASTSESAIHADLEKCEIGSLLGDDVLLNKFVKQRYISVSRITGGATANSLGQFAQNDVVNFLKNVLHDNFHIVRNGHIQLDGYEKVGGMPFDIVVEYDKKKIGIEISFQVTTNSTIERKAGQAAERQRLMHEHGYSIAYVIDGAGNFQRSSAITEICRHSDCTVAYNLQEFNVLASWIQHLV